MSIPQARSVLNRIGVIIDAETLAICTIYRVSYPKGRILKALSFGLPCSPADLSFSVGRDENNRTDRRKVWHHLAGLLSHPARFPIRKTATGERVIQCPSTLRALRLAMGNSDA